MNKGEQQDISKVNDGIKLVLEADTKLKTPSLK
jgi:hypothetical protein